MKTTCANIISSLLLAGALHGQQLVTLDVNLDPIPLTNLFGDPVEGYYLTTGQSAFIQSRTSSGTSGGAMDGISSSNTQIQFFEVFPPPTLEDYLTFSYFGIVESYDENGLLFDRSLIAAFQPGTAEGLLADGYFGYTESDLVTAFATFDSPEFLNVLNSFGSIFETSGTIALPDTGRPGDTLDLIAFTGGPNGDLGVRVGSLSMQVTQVIPEPTSLILSLASTLTLLRRRR
jgi:hypothetical protein